MWYSHKAKLIYDCLVERTSKEVIHLFWDKRLIFNFLWGYIILNYIAYKNIIPICFTSTKAGSFKLQGEEKGNEIRWWRWGKRSSEGLKIRQLGHEVISIKTKPFAVWLYNWLLTETLGLSLSLSLLFLTLALPPFLSLYLSLALFLSAHFVYQSQEAKQPSQLRALPWPLTLFNILQFPQFLEVLTQVMLVFILVFVQREHLGITQFFFSGLTFPRFHSGQKC